MNKKGLQWLFLSILSLLVVGCSEKGASEDKLEQKTVEQTATISVTQELNSIDPANTVDANSNIVLNNIYEGLYRLNNKNQPEPAGALQLPTISDDGLVYTITLRKDAKWSDGTAVTANDYVFAWKRAIGAKNATENGYLYENIENAKNVLDGVGKVEDIGIAAIDDETIQIKLNRPTQYFTTLLAIPAFFPLKQTYVEQQGEKFASDSDHAIYNGPFVLTDYTGSGISSHWTYTKNIEYWDKDNVQMQTIHVKVIKENGTSINLFENDELDETNISGEYAKELANSTEFVVEQPAQTIFLGYNQTEKLYQNKKIRQAFSLLIDRNLITEQLLANGVEPATGIIFPNLFLNEQGTDFTKASGNHLKKDVEKAKQLWEEGKKEVGLTTTDTVTLRLISFENEDMKKVAEYLKEEIDRTFHGVEVEISIYPVSVFMKNASNQAFDLYLVSWGADYPDPTSLFKLFTSDSAYNWGKYTSLNYDDLLNDIDHSSELDTEERWSKMLELEKILMDEQGITPIYFGVSTYLRKETFKNVTFHNVGPRFEYKNAYVT